MRAGSVSVSDLQPGTRHPGTSAPAGALTSSSNANHSPKLRLRLRAVPRDRGMGRKTAPIPCGGDRTDEHGRHLGSLCPPRHRPVLPAAGARWPFCRRGPFPRTDLEEVGQRPVSRGQQEPLDVGPPEREHVDHPQLAVGVLVDAAGRGHKNLVPPGGCRREGAPPLQLGSTLPRGRVQSSRVAKDRPGRRRSRRRRGRRPSRPLCPCLLLRPGPDCRRSDWICPGQ